VKSLALNPGVCGVMKGLECGKCPTGWF